MADMNIIEQADANAQAMRDEIVRLRAEVDAERELADQLAEAVTGLHHAAIIGVYRPTEELAASTAALAAYEEARRG